MRIKTGPRTKQRHKKILNLAKGFWMSRSTQIKKASEAVLHAGQYAYEGRKNRKRDFRSLWIVRINAAAKEAGMSYSQFINGLSKKKIEVDRKILAQIAVEHPQIFKKIVDHVK